MYKNPLSSLFETQPQLLKLAELYLLSANKGSQNVKFAITIANADPFHIQNLLIYVGESPVDSILHCSTLRYLDDVDSFIDATYEFIIQEEIYKLDDFIERLNNHSDTQQEDISFKLSGNVIELPDGQTLICSDNEHARSLYLQLFDRLKDLYIEAFELLSYRQHVLKEVDEDEFVVEPITNYRFFKPPTPLVS